MLAGKDCKTADVQPGEDKNVKARSAQQQGTGTWQQNHSPGEGQGMGVLFPKVTTSCLETFTRPEIRTRLT